MRVIRPRDWSEALTARRDVEAVPIAGGTDVMVAMAVDGLRPDVLLDLTTVHGSADHLVGPGSVRCGPCVSYTTIEEQLRAHLPGLAAAAAGVGSRQVRNRGTLGGGLGTASPSGDLHPVLLAAGADIELSSVRGSRRIPADGFYLDGGGTAISPDELVTAVRIPVQAGPQAFRKIGLRRGMVTALCSFAITVDLPGRRIRAAVGAYGRSPCRARAAEQLVFGSGVWERRGPLPATMLDEFGRLVAAATEAVGAGRTDPGYRRRAMAVLAARGLEAVWARLPVAGPR